jgi:uncharacterized membrane-anchored protein YhcB (DUF1043 family)
MKFFPESIRKTENRIAGYESDVEHLKTLVSPQDGKMSVMTIMGTEYTEKEAAGKALIEACKKVRSNETLDLGNYKDFDMAVSYDSFGKVFTVELKREMTHSATLGADVLGNITRINHALEAIPRYLESSVNQLETLKSQLETAKCELGKPFPQETELNEKMARLGELNILLNIDGGKEDNTLAADKIADKKPLGKMSIHEKMDMYKEKMKQDERGNSTELNKRKENEI